MEDEVSAGPGHLEPSPPTDSAVDEIRLHVVLDACPAGIVMVDEAGSVLLANAELLRMFGYRSSELLGQPIERLVPPGLREEHPRLRAEFNEAPHARLMGAGRDLFGIRADGTEFPVEVGLNPARTPDGSVVICSVVDISARKQAERELADSARAMKHANEALEQLAQVVSHDIRAPLRGILATTQWLEEDLVELGAPAPLENLNLLKQRTEHLMALVEGILRYSRAGLSETEVELVDADRVAHTVLDSLEVPPGITVRIASPLPHVLFDRTQLSQVLQNLIGNACSHMGKPSGEIHLSAASADDHWAFTVRDTGVGIPSGRLERVFDLFKTFGRAPDGRPGIGLGLAIVKRIVERNGGSVRVQSQVGVGTSFCFTLPIQPNKRTIEARSDAEE